MKVKLIKATKHIVPVFVAVFVLFGYVCIPAVNAAGYTPISYKDHIYFENSGEGTTTFSVVIPQKMWYWYTDIGDGYDTYEALGSKSFFVNNICLVPTKVAWRPTGFNVINVTEIPDGSRIRLNTNLSLEYSGKWIDGLCYYYFRIYYYGDTGNYLGQDVIHRGQFNIMDNDGTMVNYIPFGDVDFTLTKPGGTAVIMPVINLTFTSNDKETPSPSYAIKVTPDHFRFFLDIDNDFLEQEQITEQTKLMEQMLLQNEELLNGTKSQNAAADNFDNNMDSVTDELGDIQQDLESVEKPDVELEELIPNNVLQGTHYLTYANTLKAFWQNNDIVIIFTIMGVLILVSFILFGRKG